MEQVPTLGRIVIYHPDEEVRKELRARGNDSEELPAIIVAVWSKTMVNLKVFTDGRGELWATSKEFGTEAGQWHWPARV